MKINCENCGEEFSRKKSDVMRSKHHYCSRKCFIESRKVSINCENCGIKMEIILSRLGTSNYHYCSRKCFNEALRNGKYPEMFEKKRKGRYIECDNCGGLIWKSPSVLKSNKHNYCSNKCYLEYISKYGFSEEHRKNISKVRYTGKSSLGLKIRNELQDWRIKVFQRDNYTCQLCHDRSRKGHAVNLNSHHIKSLKDIMEEFNIETVDDALKCDMLWDIKNGITLCHDCHWWVHRLNPLDQQ